MPKTKKGWFAVVALLGVAVPSLTVLYIVLELNTQLKAGNVPASLWMRLLI